MGVFVCNKSLFLEVVNICGFIGDHIPNLSKFCSLGGDFIAYLSCLHSVSHFVVKCVNYWNP